jgi:hypothetical protein
MRYFNRFLILVLAMQVLGCTYTEPLTHHATLNHPFSGSFRDQSKENDKIDLKVGIVRDSNLDNLRFRASNGSHGVDIIYGSAYAEALKEKLSTIFSEVDFILVPTPKADYDVFAFQEFAWEETARDPVCRQTNLYQELILARDTFGL